MGELIVPCIFKKCYLSNNGNLCWKEFAVEGRRNNLSSIRRKILQDHKHLYRIKTWGGEGCQLIDKNGVM